MLPQCQEAAPHLRFLMQFSGQHSVTGAGFTPFHRSASQGFLGSPQGDKHSDQLLLNPGGVSPGITLPGRGCSAPPMPGSSLLPRGSGALTLSLHLFTTWSNPRPKLFSPCILSSEIVPFFLLLKILHILRHLVKYCLPKTWRI